ncbi:hypothetical protein [Mucilaginibacter sp.]
MKQSLTYSLKVWLTSVISGTIILCLILLIAGFLDLNISTIGLFIYYCSFCALFFSIPVLLLFLLSTYFLRQETFSIARTKIMLSLLGLAFTLAILIFIFANGITPDHINMGLFLIPYPTALVLSIWYFVLKID